jgi:hypothetical protein
VRRAWVLLTVGVLVAAAVAVVVLTRGGSDDEDPAARTLTGADAIACASLLADVTVLGSVKSTDDQVLLTVHVTTYLSPPGGPKKVQVTVTDPGLGDHGLEPWAEGTEGLLVVPTARRLPASFFTGADHDTQLAAYQAELGAAQDRDCPAEYS